MMSKSDLAYFKLLKEELEKKYKTKHESCNLEITKWRQQEIIRFQELMEHEVNDRISEKWFYTHIKNENNKKLPRIDTLNLLCRFTGYKDWENFVATNNLKGTFNKKITFSKSKLKKGAWISVAAVLIVFLVIAFSNVQISAQEKYIFCFVDSDLGNPIKNADIEIHVLHEDQSSELIKCNSEACFEYKTDKQKIQFIVKAAYYKTDTIVRILDKEKDSEIIKLKPDDYATMIHIFSTSKVEDWEKRRNQLNEMIADNAKIYQVDNLAIRGIEIYNKEEFIDKMTMPINSLKNIRIIENQYVDDKIIMLRFTQEVE